MEESSGGVPAWVVSGIVCLLLSVPGTYVALTLMGFKPKDAENVHDIMADAKARQGKNSPNPGPAPMAKDQSQTKADMVKNMEVNRPANRLVSFVEKLDALTADPPKLQIPAAARGKLLDHLKELTDPDFLNDPFAQDQLIAMQKLLEDQSKVFEDAGFKWADFSPIGNTKPPKNPFRDGDAGQHLKAVQDRLSKAG